MIKKNDEVEILINGYGSDGEGVGKFDGFVIFVPHAIAGEQVLVHIIKVTKNYGVGKLVKVIKPSDKRVEPVCSHFEKCGGCTLQHMNYMIQLEYKRDKVKNALEKIGGLGSIEVSAVKGSLPYGYRNKSAFPLALNARGELEICMYKNLSHNPVFISECPITNDENVKIAMAFEKVVNRFFNDTKKYFKHLVIRTLGGKSLVTVVTTKHIKNSIVMFNAIKNELQKDESMIGLFECIKKTDNNVILDGDIVHLQGIKLLEIETLGVTAMVSPMSFFQVNLEIMSQIYSKVQSHLKGQVVVDAYSGAGLMSGIVAKVANKVYGIEIVKDATIDADLLKQRNGLTNLININGDAGEEYLKLASSIGCHTLILDPPRKGVSEKIINTISSCLPKQIIYVSCDPATLARDLKSICALGYEINEVSPYDMFPETSHVETLVVLTKKV